MVTFSFCVPLSIFIINKLKLSIGMGPSYKFDKSNVYHVFFLGNILGGISLIILLKLLVNIPYQLKKLFKK